SCRISRAGARAWPARAWPTRAWSTRCRPTRSRLTDRGASHAFVRWTQPAAGRSASLAGRHDLVDPHRRIRRAAAVAVRVAAGLHARSHRAESIVAGAAVLRSDHAAPRARDPELPDPKRSPDHPG